mmetsp:Transcript_25876/g.41862  ORF Transcript_25876/g.41862 Transcript_25876/m.41862 type:complete len:518 (-) Transcript_25876:2452-4005(-)
MGRKRRRVEKTTATSCDVFRGSDEPDGRSEEYAGPSGLSAIVDNTQNRVGLHTVKIYGFRQEETEETVWELLKSRGIGESLVTNVDIRRGSVCVEFRYKEDALSFYQAHAGDGIRYKNRRFSLCLGKGEEKWSCSACRARNSTKLQLCFQCKGPRSIYSLPSGQMGDAVGEIRTLRVSSFPVNTTGEFLRHEFQKIAPVKSVVVSNDTASAYVEFSDVEGCQQVYTYCSSQDGKLITSKGFSLVVEKVAAVKAPTRVEQHVQHMKQPSSFQIALSSQWQHKPNSWPKPFDENESGFVLSSTPGLYYDVASQFYYNSESKLYFSCVKQEYFSYTNGKFECYTTVQPSVKKVEVKLGTMKRKGKKDKPKKTRIVEQQETPAVKSNGGQRRLKARVQFACLLCMRKFKSKEKLERHNNLSLMHQTNLGRQDNYQDRAKARRTLFGQSDNPDEQQQVKNHILNTPIDVRNKGASLLQSMGWSYGEGAGKDAEGIVNPIDAIKIGGRTGRAGIGAKKVRKNK